MDFDDYANKNVRNLFDGFNSDKNREWAWMVIQKVKEYFPKADHYAVQSVFANGKKRPVVKIGIKRMGGEKASRNFLNIAKDKSDENVCLWADEDKSKKKIFGNLLKGNTYVNSTESNDDAVLQWLKSSPYTQIPS